jgi:DNA sulfur modification protein DndD
MQIKSIQLCNFRRYRGQQPPIAFSIDPEKNVTVILGSNTAGKTTIVQAFLWCLYGDSKTSFKTKEVINTDAELDLLPGKYCDVFVEIVLIHENKEFIIRRTQRFSLGITNKLKSDDSILKIEYKEADNGNQQRIPANECKDTIKKILPEALSDYFFFDGERITDINNRGDVVSAVRGLMGLDVISEARNRLDPKRSGSITSKLKSELDLGSDKKSLGLKKALVNKQDELSRIIKRITTAKDEIEFFSRKKDELKEKLAQNSQAKALQKRRSDLEKDVASYQRNINDSSQRILSDFRKGAMSFFALPLIDRALSVIENSNQNGEGIIDMRQGAIDHILERGKCICGCDLNENEGAVKKIKHERSLLPPEHIGTTLRDTKGALLKYRDDSTDYVSTIQSDYKSWRRNINSLDEKARDLKNASDEILASGSVDVAQIESDYQKNETTLSDKQHLLESLISQKGAVERDIENAEKRIDSLAATSDKNRILQKRILYSEALFNWFDKSYSKREVEIKKNLLDSVNRIFAEMYHGQRIVTIDDKYRITLLAQVASQQRSIDESRGLEAVKNFSFIAGLVDIARQKMNRGDISSGEQFQLGIETEAFPLVMDAPFSNADEVHINNISRIIPGIAEQIVLIVMQKDWEYAKKALEDKVGKCYTIEKIEGSETYSTIREDA